MGIGNRNRNKNGRRKERRWKSRRKEEDDQKFEKKSKCGELAPPDFKPYYKRRPMKTVWC